MSLKQTISQNLSHYGMAIVLLLLCVYCSLATIQQQHPVGASAGDSVAGAIASKANVLIVSGTTDDDKAFADRIAQRVEADGGKVVARVAGTPGDLREALEKLAGSGTSISTIAATEAFGASPLLERLGERFPPFANAQVVTPKPYKFPTFLNRSNLINVANQVVVIALLAVGMSLVIFTAGIDLSVGSLVAISSVTTALCIRANGGEHAGVMAMILGAAVGIAVAGLMGLSSGLMITAFELPPFIATLGVMQIANGLAYRFADNQSISEIPATFTFIGRGAIAGVPVGVLLMVVVYVLAHLVMSRTTFGRYVYAVGGNREATRLSGVRVKLILVSTYVISGLFAGLGGVVVTSQLGTGGPQYGLGYELDAIAAVVVGGASLSGGSGRIFSTLIGALIIAVIKNWMNLTGVESNMQKVVLGAVIVIAVTIDTARRQGRFRRRPAKTA